MSAARADRENVGRTPMRCQDIYMWIPRCLDRSRRCRSNRRLAVAVPLVLTPGASTAVVLRNSLAGGTRAGLETSVGANAGSLVYGLLCAFGFSLALQRWPSVWVVLRVVGVAYLAWLGARSVHRATVGSGTSRAMATRAEGRPPTRGQNLKDGFVTNV